MWYESYDIPDGIHSRVSVASNKQKAQEQK